MVAAFILPAQHSGVPTSAVILKVSFDNTWSALIEYRSAEDMQNLAFHLIEVSRNMRQVGRDKEKLTALRRQFDDSKKKWDILTDHAKFANIQDKSDVVLSADVLEVAGSSVVLAGSGADINVDRVWLRDRLQSYVLTRNEAKQHRLVAAIKCVQLFAPSKILSQGITLVLLALLCCSRGRTHACCQMDLPGTNDSDVFNRLLIDEGLQSSDVVCALLSKGLGGQQSCLEALSCSPFLPDRLMSTNNTDPTQHGRLYMLHMDRAAG